MCRLPALFWLALASYSTVLLYCPSLASSASSPSLAAFCHFPFPLVSPHSPFPISIPFSFLLGPALRACSLHHRPLCLMSGPFPRLDLADRGFDSILPLFFLLDGWLVRRCLSLCIEPPRCCMYIEAHCRRFFLLHFPPSPKRMCRSLSILFDLSCCYIHTVSL